MLDNFSYRKSLLWVDSKHSCDKVDEFITEMTCLVICRMHCPEWGLIIREKGLVARVGISCLEEWYVLRTHNEQDYPTGKEVSLECLILI